METKTETSQNKDHYLEFDNLPNRLTLFRIILVPILILGLLLGEYEFFKPYKSLLGWIAGWTFVVASITDFLDGYIARKRNIVTMFGSFLDPIADKFLVITSLILLQHLDRIHVLVVIILVIREVYMTSLRLLASSEGVSVPVSKTAKWKTGMQMTGIPMLMANEPLFGIPLTIIGPITIYFASFLSILSALQYSAGLIKKIKLKQHQKKLEKSKKNFFII